jgi:hypothetical protein
MTDPILTAWLTVIGRDGWAAARIDAVAAAAGRSAGDVAAVLPDRWSALAAFGRDLDTAALAEAGADRDASVRDRLFALIMARFDAAQDQRAAVTAIAAAVRRDPGLAAFMLLRVPPSVARLAEAAGVATGGLTGPLRVQALTALYLDVARAWLADDSADLAATMKALDTRLAQAETWARRLPYRVAPAAVPTPPPIPALPAAAPRSADDRRPG